MSTRTLIKESLKILNICGINPASRTKWNKIKASVILLLVSQMNLEMSLQLILNWKGWNSVNIFIVLTAFIQVVFKLVFLLTKGRTINKLINNLDKFFPRNLLQKEFQVTLESICDVAMTTMKMLMVSAIIACSAVCFRPLLANDGSLPYETYHPIQRNFDYKYFLMYVLETVVAIAATICIFGFDSLFISLIIHTICEIKIIKKRLLAMQIDLKTLGDDWDNLQEMKRLIEHHNSILEHIKSMDDSYSGFLMVQFSSSMLCLCAGLLHIVANGSLPNFIQLGQTVTFIATVLTQLLIYCSIGEYLKTETGNVCDAVYNSRWWIKTQPKLRNAFVLIIVRSVKCDGLTAGKMFDLNLASFTGILRFSLSFFTLAQALYKN